GVVGVVRHVGEAGGAGHGGTVQGPVEHQDEVLAGDGVVGAELSGGDAADDAVVIAVLHRRIGPVIGGDVGVDVVQAHRDGLGDAAGGGSDGSAGAAAGGGEHAVLGDGAHVSGDGPG